MDNNISNNVNSIINNLCDKLGTTVDYLIPEMAKYYITRHTVGVIISIIIIIILCIFLTIIYKSMKNGDIDYDIPDYLFLFGIATIVEFIPFFIFVYNLTELSGYLASPTAAVIKEILFYLNR